MRLRPQSIKSHLANPMAPIYVLSGDEPWQMQDCLYQILQSAKQQGYSSTERYYVDHKFDWQNILMEQQSLSLFADQRILLVRFPNNKVDDKARKALDIYLANMDKNNILVLMLGKLESSQTKSKWLKKLDDAGVIIQVWPIPLNQLPSWIIQKGKENHLTIEPQAAQWLAGQTEGNLLACAQEIDKLALNYPSQNIDMNRLQNCITNHARYDLFQLCDTLLQGDGKKALHIMRYLREEGTESILILWALSRESRLLYKLYQSLAQGNNLAKAYQQNGVWDKRKPLLKCALDRLTQQQCANLISQSRQVDAMIKGVQKGNPWNALESMLLTLTTPTNGKQSYAGT